jgi:positive regulator of sigma E activity
MSRLLDLRGTAMLTTLWVALSLAGIDQEVIVTLLVLAALSWIRLRRYYTRRYFEMRISQL